MLSKVYHLAARVFRLLPKTIRIKHLDMEAAFFVPINNHYVCSDLSDLSQNKREPELYRWLNNLDTGSVLFDIGTSYGQEAALASSLIERDVRVVGFDCSLYASHFCALNKKLNDERFRFVFAAVSETSGDLMTLKSNSDTHIPRLHKKNVQYEYEVMTLALDDFSEANDIYPSHMKIDVDGAEMSVLRGASKILSSQSLKEIFIEVDEQHSGIIDLMESHGFTIDWQIHKKQNTDILFSRS
jgi:FkbM family methyltransferase